jgi:hypothetical protein
MWLASGAVVAVLAGLAGSGVLVWSASNAAFSGTTDNTANSWAAGTVSLTDDDATAAMFSATNLTPASGTLTKCIVVTYGGSVTAPVKLYTGAAGLTGTGLGTYLDFTIDVGTGGTFAGGCGAFVTGGNIYTGTLANFASTYTNYSNGLATTWSPTGATQTKVFKFSYSVQSSDTAQGKNCSLPWTWEAQG